ncbi:MAG: DUF2157 domain-containing protein, partial [Cupriavidus sp.]|nr:DUF2157 domain-containing protein [Cupriavidus sp.]
MQATRIGANGPDREAVGERRAIRQALAHWRALGRLAPAAVAAPWART